MHQDGRPEILEKAGWYEGRCIDIKKMLELLKERGFEIFPPVINFLNEFGNLHLQTPTYHCEETIVKYGFPRFHKHTTDVIDKMGDAGNRRMVVPYEDIAGENLVIVGLIHNRHLALMIGESGKVYCDTGKLGDDFAEAWECIVNQKRLVPWGKV